MDILILFKALSFLMIVGLSIFAIKTVHNRRLLFYAITMLAFFFLSTVLFTVEGETSIFNEWAKHTLFFIGQLFLYLFLANLIERASAEGRSSLFYSEQSTQTLHAVAGGSLIIFLTEEGLQHFLAVPLLLIIVSAIRVQSVHITLSVLRQSLTVFMLGAASLAMIHLGEFVVESQGIIPSLEGTPIEIIEFLWFYLGAFLFVRGFLLLKKVPLVS